MQPSTVFGAHLDKLDPHAPTRCRAAYFCASANLASRQIEGEFNRRACRWRCCGAREQAPQSYCSYARDLTSAGGFPTNQYSLGRRDAHILPAFLCFQFDDGILPSHASKLPIAATLQVRSLWHRFIPQASVSLRALVSSSLFHAACIGQMTQTYHQG